MDSLGKGQVDEFSRDALERFMKDYNKTYGGNYTLNIDNGYNAYFKNVAKNMKERNIDILLVVNMFLTGFDSKTLNTLYVDKNLKYHGLIQAFSRTNRILNEEKSHGNIVSFRNLKDRVDEAITLYSDSNASEIVLMKPYEEYVKAFNKNVEELKEFVPSVDSVNELEDEVEQAKFIEKFRELIRLNTKLSVFTDFTFDHLDIGLDEFEGYKSKYLDIYEKVARRGKKEKVSILDDINFEVELLQKDEINVHYIIMLLKKLRPNSKNFESDKENILSKMAGDPKLRNKRELIEEFIESQLIYISDEDEFNEEFEKFILKKKDEEFGLLIEKEQLIPEKIEEFIDEYYYQEQETPKTETEAILKDSFKEKLKFSEKRKKRKKVLDMVLEFLKKFDFGDLVG
jgi:type I restriction enzyme R subunit